jgi:hypothetical protein
MRACGLCPFIASGAMVDENAKLGRNEARFLHAATTKYRALPLLGSSNCKQLRTHFHFVAMTTHTSKSKCSIRSIYTISKQAFSYHQSTHLPIHSFIRFQKSST